MRACWDSKLLLPKARESAPLIAGTRWRWWNGCTAGPFCSVGVCEDKGQLGAATGELGFNRPWCQGLAASRQQEQSGSKCRPPMPALEMDIA